MEQDDSNVSELDISPLDHQATASPRRRPIVRWLRSWPGRLTLSALCAALVIAALVTLVFQGASDPLGTIYDDFAFITPTPSPPIPPGGDSFIILDTVPWGKLTVDGQSPKLSEQYGLGIGFTLARGAHHLLYQAQHFSTLRCMISVPASSRDTCPLQHINDSGATYQRSLDLLATPQRLDSMDYQALISTVQSTLVGLATTATVEPGERYLNSSGQAVIAQSWLTFTLGVTLVSQSGAQLTPCETECASFNLPSTISRQWYLLANAEPTWAVFAGPASSGSTFATTEPNLAAQIVVEVTTNGDSGWEVLVEPHQGILDFMAQSIVENAFQTTPGVDVGLGGGATSGTNPANGAVAFTQTVSGAIQALVLWRFGILYAANATAMAQCPSLPRASKSDQALALTIMNGLTGQTNG
jgi:hypothetical protein